MNYNKLLPKKQIKENLNAVPVEHLRAMEDALHKLHQYYLAGKVNGSKCPLCITTMKYTCSEVDCKRCTWTWLVGTKCVHPGNAYGRVFRKLRMHQIHTSWIPHIQKAIARRNK